MKTLLLLLTLTALGGCAHKDLKAPCTNIAALNANIIPCDQREIINTTLIPSVFAH